MIVSVVVFPSKLLLVVSAGQAFFFKGYANKTLQNYFGLSHAMSYMNRLTVTQHVLLALLYLGSTAL